MKLAYLATAATAFALVGGLAYAQQPAAPTPGSVTGDWNGAHAPSDDKQYTETVKVPLGAPADVSADAAAGATTVTETPAPAPAATDTAVNTSATFTSMTVTNGPVPDTAENRAKYGQPMSRAGKMTAAKGN
ncbi:hypothetical protein [Phenylobacterium sp.]|uniref:hypothetical protein n=1 Tax=Phenylobacterium sp. TaxID=1871053 RepID=UPI0025D18F8D|nr:hypothetical protein [Phenylobacterium sp.]MBX3485101.1 hypothetical protein [Phenylobacterium sp.]MCW5760846.1 hypothetical protein [Phenylobacterium sp.]